MVEKVKRVLEPFYKDKCTVYEKEAVTGDGLTEFTEKVKYKDIPCRVSVKSYLFGESTGYEADDMLNVTKKVKLFFQPGYEILPGSRLEIESCGKKRIYAKSGEISLYSTHNEVMVELWKNYA